MAASRQALNSSTMSISANCGDFRRIPNSCSASSSCTVSYAHAFTFLDSPGKQRQIAWCKSDCLSPTHLQCAGLPIVRADHNLSRRIGIQICKNGLRGSVFRIPLASSALNEFGGKRRSSLRVECSSSDASAAGERTDTSIELPLFPLPLVLFPGAILPLQIFEFRYRIMMHTLLQTDLRFGVVYTDKASGLAAVGCVGEVVKHERLVDDRFFMICKGQERFRVIDIVRTKPYLVAKVQWLEDRPSDEQEDVETLANEVESYMKDVIRLSNRVNGKPEKVAPDDLRKKLFPTPFSFWVGSTFEGAPVEQQALLELEDTAQRLKREKETLRNTLNYLSAASAVKDAFPSAE
ncbi:uncharacterized protein MPTK1_7g16460 [Marchantia polymorpha subsp. ruderalis]|uniref:Lon N-terminal domain-containing protein n=2 Tax=Marchantia polymorpha TaxID=3197 RepID=A0AAF6C0D4_MARPO|nr:hypothetical protein MARPO_0123s0028 [Marchantia polymorpha]BBN17718.1 hypothetical protein Mp_7g16460 [Marchantia polymorpha subsp. ruderalis]|eukprot:PTQ30541.1 hypothetical protein MARPO_0123s0028 [Marchantia polymorpha]